MVSSTLLFSVVGLVVAGMAGMTGIIATLLRGSIQDLGVLLTGRMDRIEIRVDRIETRVGGIETRVDRIETKVDDLGARLTRLESDLSGSR